MRAVKDLGVTGDKYVLLGLVPNVLDPETVILGNGHNLHPSGLLAHLWGMQRIVHLCLQVCVLWWDGSCSLGQSGWVF
jgi:hypothetical protein